MSDRSERAGAVLALAACAACVGVLLLALGSSSGRVGELAAQWATGALLLGLAPLIALVGAAILLGGEAAAPAPPEPPAALRALERRLTRARLRQRSAVEWELDGRLGGERVSVRASTLASEAQVRVDAAVPVSHSGVFVQGWGDRAAQRTRDGPPPQAVYAREPAATALRSLVRRCRRVDVGLRALEATLVEPVAALDFESFADRLEQVARELIALASVVRSDAPPPPDPVARVLATRTRTAAAPDAPILGVRQEGQVCPYCRDGLDRARDDVVACSACATPHHRACFEENGRCTVRGCERRDSERVVSG